MSYQTGTNTTLVAGGKVVQSVHTSDGEVYTGSTLTPIDNTIPTSSEGNAFSNAFDTTITPSNSANILDVEVKLVLSSTAAGNYITIALFQDSGASAIQSTIHYFDSATVFYGISLKAQLVAGTISPTTLRIRVGGHTAGTLATNGRSADRRHGGILDSSMTIKELAP